MTKKKSSDEERENRRSSDDFADNEASGGGLRSRLNRMGSVSSAVASSAAKSVSIRLGDGSNERYGQSRLSIASKALDRGNKGYLDEFEQIARKYDVDGDGQFSREEVMRIVEDLEQQRRRKRGYKKGVFGMVMVAIVLLACMFGLTFAAVILATKVGVDSSDGSVLVSAETGEIVATAGYIPRVLVDFTDKTFYKEFALSQENQLPDQRRMTTGVTPSWKKYLGLTYIGRTSLLTFETKRDQSLTTGGDIKLEPAQTEDGEAGLVVNVNSQYYRNITEDDQMGGTRWVGLTDTRDGSHLLFSCGGVFTDECLIFRLNTPVATVGGTTTTSTNIGFRTAYPAPVQLRYSAGGLPQTETDWVLYSTEVTTTEDNDYTGSIDFAPPNPNGGWYYYQLMVDGVPFEAPSGFDQKFKLFPGRSTSAISNKVEVIIYADAAVSKTGETAPAYVAAQHSSAILALQIGDFDHSDNIGEIDGFIAGNVFANVTQEEKDEYLGLIRRMAQEQRNPFYPQGNALAKSILSRMTFAHVWDDHDYCGNDSDRLCKFKDEAIKAYKEYYPGYDLPEPGVKGIWHKISIGDADIFMLDMRTQRDPKEEPDNSEKTVLGSVQKQWLKDGLANSDATWKIIVSSISANKNVRPGNPDHWISYQSEAAELKEFLSITMNKNEESVPLSQRSVMVTGDIHTGGCIDSGCNNHLGIPEVSVPHTNLWTGGNADSLGLWSVGATSGNYQNSNGNVGGYAQIGITDSALTLKIKDADGVDMKVWGSDGVTPARNAQGAEMMVALGLPNDPNCPVQTTQSPSPSPTPPPTPPPTQPPTPPPTTPTKSPPTPTTPPPTPTKSPPTPTTPPPTPTTSPPTPPTNAANNGTTYTDAPTNAANKVPTSGTDAPTNAANKVPTNGTDAPTNAANKVPTNGTDAPTNAANKVPTNGTT